jgi:hypothetical protein
MGSDKNLDILYTVYTGYVTVCWLDTQLAVPQLR